MQKTFKKKFIKSFFLNFLFGIKMNSMLYRLIKNNFEIFIQIFCFRL